MKTMSNKDYAILNYYLTILRGLLLKRLEDNTLCDDVREEYIKQIDNINDIMKFHILEGEDNE